MYDDRLEIISPGGMIDGTQIQNLEIGKVPSMRRNAIISDVFSRLHYMDRRGSGLVRILESYNDAEEKPKFLSDESFFTVILPNKGYVKENTIVETSNQNIVSDEDYFFLKILNKLSSQVSSKTLLELKLFFSKYSYAKSFTKEDIKTSFKVQNSRASEIVSLLLKNELIEDLKNNEYKFKK